MAGLNWKRFERKMEGYEKAIIACEHRALYRYWTELIEAKATTASLEVGEALTKLNEAVLAMRELRTYIIKKGWVK